MSTGAEKTRDITEKSHFGMDGNHLEQILTVQLDRIRLPFALSGNHVYAISRYFIKMIRLGLPPHVT